MTLRHPEYFVAIAEEGTFTGAAQRLRVAQRSLSHPVWALELELGGELLERLAAYLWPPAARTRVATAPQLAASGLAPTLVPDSIIPASLREMAPPLKPPPARQVVAFTRQEWSPIARGVPSAAQIREHPGKREPRG